MDRDELLRMMEKEDYESESCFRYEKVGDALRFAMVHELPELAGEGGEGNAPNFYATVAYLYLHNYISNAVAERVYKTVCSGAKGIDMILRVIEEVSRVLLEGLRKELKFYDFDELVEELNNHELPDWCFYIGDQLVKQYVGSSFIQNEVLYYIDPESPGFEGALLKIYLRVIHTGTDLSRRNHTKVLVSGFRDILGVDDKLQRVYLKLYDQESGYAYYDILDDKLVICENKYLAFVDGTVFVITRDKYIGMVMGDVIHSLKEYHVYENLEARKDCFFITPDLDKGVFFFPYYLFFDGRVIQAGKGDYSKVLWDYFSRGLGVDDSNPLVSFGLGNSREDIPAPKVFSIRNIREILRDFIPREERCSNKRCVLLEQIFDVISPYLDEKRDYIRLWYALCKADIALNKKASFPSEELYWRLKEIEIENHSEENSLAALLQTCNYDKLVEELIKEIGFNVEDEYKMLDEMEDVKEEWEYEVGMYDPEKANHKIGSFTGEEDGFVTFSMDLEDGMYLGSHIVPEVNLSHRKGVVTYDAYRKRSYITCDRELSSVEKLRILKDFKLDEARSTFVLQKRTRNSEERFYDDEERWMAVEKMIPDNMDEEESERC